MSATVAQGRLGPKQANHPDGPVLGLTLPAFIKTAREEGFKEIADWFETLTKAEKSHAEKFWRMLDSIK